MDGRQTADYLFQRRQQLVQRGRLVQANVHRAFLDLFKFQRLDHHLDQIAHV